ncbi:predicted protein [Naegleria gruberi]|uniref:Predicted protein n=1 Tax=Naegleria gruberi TaxID=5762 RepID=D2W385_NAEGR|nr:uncharacterized protein NAEGRDRAFT_75855 [Naegleria gruberi]EFC36471.1 predicted protein [Naegleria gruberi]|eukprot:XP_002669215.1 predicted protein [Naegleria gruberi strain NEG-M]
MASRQTATMIDVYSFAIIMWEVFFEVIPYSSSFKLTRMYETNNEEERLWSNVSLFNIPGLVVKGLRPIIPFKTEDQIFKWISEYMLPDEKTSPNIVIVVMKYFEIVKRNWDHNATLRSPISNIRSDLEDLLALLEMN